MPTLLAITVFLDKSARERMTSEAVRRRLRETGGSVFGWEQHDDIVVACVSGPGPNAKHRMSSFEPARATTEAAIAAVLDASGGRYGYLGSWHTHPRGVPVPSAIDLATAKAMAEQKDLKLPGPLLLILATTGTSKRVRPGKLCAWRWVGELGGLSEVEVQSCRSSTTFCPPDHQVFIDAATG